MKKPFCVWLPTRSGRVDMERQTALAESAVIFDKLVERGIAEDPTVEGVITPQLRPDAGKKLLTSRDR